MILDLVSRSTTSAASAETAYNLWRSIVERNINKKQFIILKNYIHDKDFYAYIEELLQQFEKEISTLRDKLDQLNLVGPNPSPRDQNLKVDTNYFTDQEIAENIYRLLRLDLVSNLLGIKYLPINDGLYQYTIDLTIISMKRIDHCIKFMKDKNWLTIPPIFRDIPGNVKEQAAINEIHLLWDHLSFRYNNLRTTQLYSAYAQDKDFSVVLNIGMHKLKEQIKILEDKLLHFGVPLPRPYPDIVPKPEINKDFFEDRYMFNSILRGIQDALVLHGAAIQEVILNDDLRKFFINLTLEEISLMTKLAKYGKIRGWAMVAPPYTIS